MRRSFRIKVGVSFQAVDGCEVGAASQLILDPDLDTYYTMDALLLREPEVVNRGHDIADALLTPLHLGRQPVVGAVAKVELCAVTSR